MKEFLQNRQQNKNRLTFVHLEDRNQPSLLPTSLVALGSDAGGPPKVALIDSSTGNAVNSFPAYNTEFTGGVHVAIGNTENDGKQYVVTSPGSGGGPHIKVFDANTGTLKRSFFAYNDDFRGGVNVAVGDVNGDGVDDILTGTGIGGGPRIRVFDGKTGDVIQDFFAFNPEFRGGVNVAVGDVNGDGYADIVAGAGVGGGPRIQVFDAKTNSILIDKFAYEDTFRGGVNVAVGDVNGDGYSDIITGAGVGGGPRIRVFNYTDNNSIWDFFSYGYTTREGVNIGTIAKPDGKATILTSSKSSSGGPDIRSFGLNSSDEFGALQTYPITFDSNVLVQSSANLTPEIYQLWNSSGGISGPLGNILKSQSLTSGGGGVIQEFQHGVILWSPNTGAHALTGSILNKWRSNGESTYGFPISDQIKTAQGDEYVEFQKGLISNTADGVLGVTGPIYDKWISDGSVQKYGLLKNEGTAGPTTNSVIVTFQNYIIFYSPSIGVIASDPKTNTFTFPYQFPSGPTPSGGDGFSLFSNPADWNIDPTPENFNRAYRPQDILDPIKQASVSPFAAAGAAGYVAALSDMEIRAAGKLATNVPLYIQEFLLREFGSVFSGTALRNTLVHWGVPPLDEQFSPEGGGGSAAQTWGYNIYVRFGFNELSDADKLILLAHELTHTMQYERDGQVLYAFGYEYFQQYALAGFDYRSNTLEQEAFGMEDVVTKRYNLRNLQQAQREQNHFIDVTNNTSSTLLVYLRYQYTPEGLFLTDPSIWNPTTPGIYLNVTVAPNSTTSLFVNGQRLATNRMQIWATTVNNDNFWLEFQYQDYVPGNHLDSNNVETVVFNPQIIF